MAVQSQAEAQVETSTFLQKEKSEARVNSMVSDLVESGVPLDDIQTVAPFATKGMFGESNDSLFVEHEENTDLFANISVNKDRPYPQGRASELATASDIINGSNVAQDTELQLRTTGSSVAVETASDEVRRGKVNSNIEAAYRASEEGDVQALAAAIEKSNKPTRISDNEIVATAAINYAERTGNQMSPEALESLEGLLEYSTGWIDYQRTVTHMLNKAEGEVFNSAEWTDVAGDVVELLTPYVSAEEERRMRSGLTDGDTSALRGFLQRSSVADDVAERLASMPTYEAVEELDKIITAVAKSETLFGGNVFFSSDVLSDIRNKLEEGRASVGEFGQSNFLSEALGLFDVLEIKSLHGLVRHLFRKTSGEPVLETTKVAQAVSKGLAPDAVVHGVGARSNGGSLLDAINVLSPKAAQDLLKSDDIPLVVTRMGATTEGLAARMMPTAERAQDGLGVNGNILDIDHKTVSVLLTPEEQTTAPLRIANRLARESGNSMKPHHQFTETMANDLDDSLGTFRYRFGVDNEAGYAYEEAVSAQAMGLVGVESKLVTRDRLTGAFTEAKPGDVDVFIESDIVHRLNPAQDAGGLNVGGKQVGGSFRRQVLPPSRYLDRDLWKRASASADFSTAQQGKIIRTANSVAKLKPKQSEALGELIRMGDADQTTFTRSSAGVALGRSLDSKTWKAYQDYQELQNQFFTMTNKRYRANLDKGGFKQFDGFGDGMQFVRPMNVKPQVKSVRQDASQDSLKALQGEDGVVWGEAWDARLGKPVKLSQELVDTLYEGGGVLGRVRGGYVDDAENIFDFVISADRTKYKPLGTDVLNKRSGYYPRFYGETGFLVLAKEIRTVNGHKLVRERPVGIAATRGDAKRLSDSIEGETSIVLSSESKGTLDLHTGGGEFGFTPRNARKRGDQLIGADGNPAAVLNPVAALQRQIQGVQSKLNVDSIGMFERRWLNTYGKYLPAEKRGVFPEKIDDVDMRFSQEMEASGEAVKVRESAKSWHDYTQLLRGADDDPSQQWMNKKLWDIGNNLSESESGVAKFFGEKLVSMTDTHTKRYLKEITSTAVITTRILYQAVANPTFAAAALLSKDPVKAIGSLASSLPLSMGLLARNSDNWDALKPAVARGLGVDVDEAEKWLKAFEDSGMFDARLSDDFLRQAKEGYAETAKNTHRSLAAHYGSKLNPFTPMRKGLSGSIIAGNMFAYNHALKEFKRLNPGRNAYGKLAQSEIVSNARLMTQTQNSVDQFAWQRGSHPASFAMQFMQFVLKAWYDMIVDPAVKVTTGKNLGEAGIWASSRTQAATTLGMVTALFGQTGILGENGGAATSDWIRTTTEKMTGEQLPEEVWQVVRGGFMDLAMNKLFAEDGSNISFSARIGPGAIADGIVWAMRDPGSFDLMGAAGSQIGWFGNAAKMSLDAAFDPNFDMTEGANQKEFFEAYSSVFAGARDIWAAYAADNAGHALTKNAQRTVELNTSEVLWRMASFRTTEELDSLRESANAKNRQEKVTEMSSRWAKWYHSQISGMPEDVSAAEVVEKRRQILQLAARSVEEHIADEFLSALINKVEPNFDAMDRRVQNAMKYNTVEGTIEQLELLKSKYRSNDVFVSGIGDLIWAYKTNLKPSE